MILVAENTLERLQQRQQILPPVKQTLKNLDSEMSNILSRKQLDNETRQHSIINCCIITWLIMISEKVNPSM